MAGFSKKQPMNILTTIPKYPSNTPLRRPNFYPSAQLFSKFGGYYLSNICAVVIVIFNHTYDYSSFKTLSLRWCYRSASSIPSLHLVEVAGLLRQNVRQAVELFSLCHHLPVFATIQHRQQSGRVPGNLTFIDTFNTFSIL